MHFQPVGLQTRPNVLHSNTKMTPLNIMSSKKASDATCFVPSLTCSLGFISPRLYLAHGRTNYYFIRMSVWRLHIRACVFFSPASSHCPIMDWWLKHLKTSTHTHICCSWMKDTSFIFFMQVWFYWPVFMLHVMWLNCNLLQVIMIFTCPIRSVHTHCSLLQFSIWSAGGFKSINIGRHY